MYRESSIRMEEVNIRTIIKDLIYNIPFIILAILTAVMGVYTYKNLVYKPEYTAKTTISVIAKGNADGNVYSSLNTATSMAEVFTEVFQSTVIKEKVEEVMGDLPENTQITSTLIPKTNLLKLNVTTNNPQSSYKILQVILQNYKYVSDYLFGNAVLEVIQDPNVPVAPSNTFYTSRLVKLAILGTVLLMSALIVVFSVFRETVKTVHAARRNLEGRHLATIPYEQKNHTLKGKILHVNKALLLNRQVVGFRYQESFNELAAKLEYELNKDNKKTVLISSVAENEGKSTICVNLAIALASRNKKVLLVDMDFGKPALCKIMEYHAKQDEQLLELYKKRTTLDKLIKYDEKLHIYAILTNDDEENHKCLNDVFLKEFLEQVEKEFDYVILDSAPVSAGSDTEYLKEFADTSILVVHQDMVPTSELNDAIELFKEGKSKFLGYVLNACDSNDVGRVEKYGYGRYASRGNVTAEE